MQPRRQGLQTAETARVKQRLQKSVSYRDIQGIDGSPQRETHGSVANPASSARK